MFYAYLSANEYNDPPIFSPIATIAAFRNGEQWRKEMLEYVEGNILALEQYCRQYIPEIKPLRPQASFLVWLDCRALGLAHEQLVSLFVDKAGLALNDGEMFGQRGQGFMRMNVACPRSQLLRALDSLGRAISSEL